MGYKVHCLNKISNVGLVELPAHYDLTDKISIDNNNQCYLIKDNWLNDFIKEWNQKNIRLKYTKTLDSNISETKKPDFLNDFFRASFPQQGGCKVRQWQLPRSARL